MPQTLDGTAASEDLERFLDTVEEESAAEGASRTRLELLFGLLAIPTLFVGLVAAIVWVVPVVATRLPVLLDVIALTRLG